jgi:hypothetical protein
MAPVYICLNSVATCILLYACMLYAYIILVGAMTLFYVFVCVLCVVCCVCVCCVCCVYCVRGCVGAREASMRAGFLVSCLSLVSLSFDPRTFACI